ncbi:hypothetical protein EVAR_89265_1 [Eumeta japonica]|uniref:Uncharacterized protein n=1 Tax=Eumeta variegata TaxID=151549 RepID=A0A4C1VKC1_EUMVA|nr:hypothetical protein EVAR_89265_1 [Eumeta japonica]
MSKLITKLNCVLNINSRSSVDSDSARFVLLCVRVSLTLCYLYVVVYKEALTVERLRQPLCSCNLDYTFGASSLQRSGNKFVDYTELPPPRGSRKSGLENSQLTFTVVKCIVEHHSTGTAFLTEQAEGDVTSNSPIRALLQENAFLGTVKNRGDSISANVTREGREGRDCIAPKKNKPYLNSLKMNIPQTILGALPLAVAAVNRDRSLLPGLRLRFVAADIGRTRSNLRLDKDSISLRRACEPPKSRWRLPSMTLATHRISDGGGRRPMERKQCDEWGSGPPELSFTGRNKTVKVVTSRLKMREIRHVCRQGSMPMGYCTSWVNLNSDIFGAHVERARHL